MALNTPNSYKMRFNAHRWAVITIQRWQKKIDKLKVKNTESLRNSFATAVRMDDNGNVKITITFRMYGRFVDMGVGRGSGIGKVKDNAMNRRNQGKMTGNRRRPKKWYSKTLRAEQLRLTEILAEEYGKSITDAIVSNLVSIKE